MYFCNELYMNIRTVFHIFMISTVYASIRHKISIDSNVFNCKIDYYVNTQTTKKYTL